MHFDGRKKKNIVSSTKSTGNRLGFSTLNDILGSETSSSEFSPLLARREINHYLLYGGNPDMGDSAKFMPLSNIGSVQGEPEPPVSEVERVDLGSSEDPDPSILSVRDLEPRHRNRDDTSSDSEHSGRLQIVRNEKTGSYHFKIKYNPNK